MKKNRKSLSKSAFLARMAAGRRKAAKAAGRTKAVARKSKPKTVTRSTVTVIKTNPKAHRAVTVHAAPVAHRRRRHARRNPGRLGALMQADGLLGAVRHAPENLKGLWTGKRGWKPYAIAGGGAIAAVFTGQLAARVTVPMVAKVSPKLAMHPLGARLLGALNYYGAGWVASRFLPQKHRRDFLAGVVVATAVEAVRPGTIMQGVRMVPLVGPAVASKLSDIELELGDYLVSMSGLADYEFAPSLSDYTPGFAAEVDPTDGSGGMIDDRLGNYLVMSGMGKGADAWDSDPDAIDTDGMPDDFNGRSMDGLGCGDDAGTRDLVASFN